MQTATYDWFDQVEPNADDLDAIEAEWPVIEAELLLLEDELDRLIPERLIEFDLDQEVLREDTTRVWPAFSLN